MALGMAACAMMPIGGDGIIEASGGLAQAAVLTQGAFVAVDGQVLEVLHVLLGSENLLELVEVLTARLPAELALRLALIGLERIHGGALVVGELDAGKRVNLRLADLASGTLALAGGAVAALLLTLLAALLAALLLAL